MRWRAYLDSLPAQDATRLPNAITTAAGHAAHAVRLQDDDAPAAAVAASWERAAAELLVARQLLAGVLGAESPAPTSPRAASHLGGSWLTTLAALPAAYQRTILSLLLTVVQETRAAGLRALEDGPVELIQAHIIAAVAALADARRLADGRLD